MGKEVVEVYDFFVFVVVSGREKGMFEFVVEQDIVNLLQVIEVFGVIYILVFLWWFSIFYVIIEYFCFFVVFFDKVVCFGKKVFKSCSRMDYRSFSVL